MNIVALRKSSHRNQNIQFRKHYSRILKKTAAPDRSSAFNAVIALPVRTVSAIFMGNIGNVGRLQKGWKNICQSTTSSRIWRSSVELTQMQEAEGSAVVKAGGSEWRRAHSRQEAPSSSRYRRSMAAARPRNPKNIRGPWQDLPPSAGWAEGGS